MCGFMLELLLKHFVNENKNLQKEMSGDAVIVQV